MRKRLTMQDIAREVGVSVAAVSHAFNKPGEISAELRQRIFRVADERGYRPDPRARALRRGESSLIALVISSLSSHYFGPLANAIQATIARQGYHLVVLSTYGTREGERECLQIVRDERMAGAIVDLYRLKPHDAAQLAEYPLVLLADRQQSFPGPAVRVDNFKAAYSAVEHLYARGCRRIAHISGPPTAANASRRRAGYRRALADLRLEPPIEVAGDFLPESGAQAMLELLAAAPWPDGVFAGNDDMALGALTVLRERRVAVPEQIAVIGFDNIKEGLWSVPTLTTVDQPTEQIGSAAASLLLAAIHDRAFAATADVQCTVVEREST